MRKVLLIDTIHPAFADMLGDFDFDIIDGSTLSREEILNIIPDFDGVVIRSRFRLDGAFLSSAKKLKFIARSGAGMENIDVDYADSKGIACINAPEGNRDAVGEHAIGMLLSLFNRIPGSDAEIRKGVWRREENRGVELQGKTVSVIGFGNMGSAFARRLSGFDVNILAYDKYIKIDRKRFPDVHQVEMEEIFEQTDVLGFHVPLTDETLHLFNESYLSNFSKNIYVINTSRGKVVNTNTLVGGLKSGKISGACLDVVEYESTSFEQLSNEALPEDWQYLIKSEKVILTPHVAGWSFESHRKLSEVLAQKVLSLYNYKNG